MREAYNIASLNRDLLPKETIVIDFASSLIELSQKCQEISRRLLLAIAYALEIDAEEILEMFKHPFSSRNFTTLRTLYYPPVESYKNGETRLGEHTGKDCIKSCITFFARACFVCVSKQRTI